MNKAISILKLLLQGQEVRLDSGQIIRLFKPGEEIKLPSHQEGVRFDIRWTPDNVYWLGMKVFDGISDKFLGYIGYEMDLCNFLSVCDKLSEVYIHSLKAALDGSMEEWAEDRKMTHCSVCGKVQFNTPSGITCPEGHGGAPSKEDEQ